jgi:hypothetical protein
VSIAGRPRRPRSGASPEASNWTERRCGCRRCRRGPGGRATRRTPPPRWPATPERCCGWQKCPQWMSWTPGCRCAGPAGGWLPGGRRWRWPGGPLSPTRSTGDGRHPASARRTRGSRCSGSPRPRTAPTAPAGSSPATAAATGSMPRCTGPGWPTGPPRCAPATGCGSPTPGSWPRSGARHRRTSRRRPSGTPAGPGWSASSSCSHRRCGWSSCWARSAGRRCGRRSPPPALPRR